MCTRDVKCNPSAFISTLALIFRVHMCFDLLFYTRELLYTLLLLVSLCANLFFHEYEKNGVRKTVGCLCVELFYFT